MNRILPAKLRQSFLRMSLTPIARFCLRHSIKLQDVQQAMKEVLVSEAVRSLKNDGVDVSASKIALITGVHRKDVASIQEGYSKAPVHADLMTKVLGQWQVDKHFSRSGVPRPLSCTGKESEFVELVRRVSKEINPYTVLFELERAGLVKKCGATVSAQAKEYVPVGNAEAVFSMYEADGSDLLSAVEQNAINESEKHLHLRTAFDNIPLSRLAELRRWIFAEGVRLHRRAREKMARYDRDFAKKHTTESATAKISVTLFEYSTQIKE